MNNDLDILRKEIDEIDEDIIDLLAKRFEIVKKIGILKKQKGVVPLDEKRWQDVLSSRIEKAIILDLPKEFIEKLFSIIHEYSIKVEEEK